MQKNLLEYLERLLFLACTSKVEELALHWAGNWPPAIDQWSFWQNALSRW